MRLRLAQPSVLVDIGRLRDLSYIRDAGDHIAIGALTRHRDIETSDLLEAQVPLLATPPRTSATRRSATAARIGGSLAHSDPASDLPATVLALGGSMVAKGPNGERVIAAKDFFTGFLESALAPDELLTEIRVPKMPGAGWSFQKFNRRAQDWAIVGVAAVHNGTTGVALVNMGSTPIFAQAVVDAVAGGRLGGRRRRSTRPTTPSRRPTSTPRSSTAPTWPRCSCAGPWKRRAPSQARAAAPRGGRTRSRSRRPGGAPAPCLRRICVAALRFASIGSCSLRSCQSVLLCETAAALRRPVSSGSNWTLARAATSGRITSARALSCRRVGVVDPPAVGIGEVGHDRVVVPTLGQVEIRAVGVVLDGVDLRRQSGEGGRHLGDLFLRGAVDERQEHDVAQHVATLGAATTAGRCRSPRRRGRPRRS